MIAYARETRDKARIFSYSDRQTSERDVKIFHGVIELKSAFARVMLRAKVSAREKAGVNASEYNSGYRAGFSERAKSTTAIHDSDANHHPFGVRLTLRSFLGRSRSRLGRKNAASARRWCYSRGPNKMYRAFYSPPRVVRVWTGRICRFPILRLIRRDSIFPGRIQCPALSHIRMIGRRISFYKC